MKTNIFKHIIAFATTAVIIYPVSAQNLSESVTVEGKYKPEIIPADRLALLPATIPLKAPESTMAFDRIGVNANFAPDALSMPATGWRTTKVYDTSKGYVNLRLGSWLNSSLSAGFAAINDENTRLNIYLQHNSTSLWQAWKEDAKTGTPAADKRFRYDETLGATLRHNFASAGNISAQLQYHLGYFNYYGSLRNLNNGKITAPTQTVNDLYANANWTGNTIGKFHYEVSADFRYFAYRAMYTPNYMSTYLPATPPNLPRTKGERESTVEIGGNLSYDLNAKSNLDIGLQYSGVINSIGNDVNRLRINPSYNMAGDNYSLRLGIYMATVGNGKTRFRLAPDVQFSMRSGISAFSAKIGGGTHLRTLAWMHQMDYYANPSQGCHQAAYSPLDIKVAYQLNPGGKWTFGLEGMWRTTLDESFGGLYQAFINNPLSTLTSEYFNMTRIKGFSVSLNGGYVFNRYFAIHGKIAWQPQHGNSGVLNGFDRPTFTADISACSHPTDKLSLSLDYGLRARRLLLPGNISRLNLSADYMITDKLSVGAELNNLLNRKEMVLPSLPTEGFNATAGVQLVF